MPLILTLQVRGPYILKAPPCPPADGQTPYPGQELRASWGPRAAIPLVIYWKSFCALRLADLSPEQPSLVRGLHRLPNSPRLTVSLSGSFCRTQRWGRRHSLRVCGRRLCAQRRRCPRLEGLGLSPSRQK